MHSEQLQQLFQRGYELLAAGHPSEAEASIRQAISLAPDMPLLHYTLGIALQRQNSHRDAAYAFERALSLSPSDSECLYHQGISYLSLKDEPHAFQNFSMVIAMDPGYAPAWMGRAQCHLLQGKLLLAESDFRHFLDHAGPEEAERISQAETQLAWLQEVQQLPSDEIVQQARQFLEAENPEIARLLVQYLLERDPNHSEAISMIEGLLDANESRPGKSDLNDSQRIDQALKDLSEGDLESAKEWLSACAESALKTPRGICASEWLHLSTDSEKHRPQLEAALKESPHDGMILLANGILNQLAEKWEVAAFQLWESSQLVESFKPAQQALEDVLGSWDAHIRATPDEIPPIIQRAKLFEEMGMWEEAIRDYSAALTLDKHQPLVWFNRARMYLHAEDDNRSIEDLHRAIEEDPNLLEARLMRAHHYGRKFRTDLALDELRQLIQIDPSYSEAWNYQGQLLAAESRSEEAWDSFNRALELNPGLVESRHGRAMGWIERGQIDQAIEDLEVAIQGSPNADWAFDCACLHIHSQQISAAEDMLNHCLMLDPEYMDAYLERGNIQGDRGNWEGAAHDWRIYLSQRPFDANTRLKFSGALAKLGHWSEVLTETNRCLLDLEKPSDALFLKGKALTHLEEWEEARKSFLKAQKDHESEEFKSQVQDWLNKLPQEHAKSKKSGNWFKRTFGR
ncbi:tetratricopeptide repeat protein [Pontibacter sp. G13]|uniref:tetratricopeptide repeat protein n=1 Tax=Pontibacter sp. G13 TaxID=3074898 RepID=UPI002889B268|nr:tetratricopeptide repeat protein [Pontibacter sp. G13]WNJ21204.1 tetratricopeptide repeat protein [Pontibacter sp. G13]